MLENFPDREKTEEEIKDEQTRILEFKNTLEELEERLQVRLLVYPQFIPSEKLGIFNITLVRDVMDVKNKVIPSPFHD